LIGKTPNLDWLLLTKRPQNWRTQLMNAFAATKGDTMKTWINGWLCGTRVPANVWIGTSVGTQKSADTRIPQLLSVPARVRFLSCEPLLANIELRDVPNSEFGEGEPHYDSLLGRAYDSQGDGTNGPKIHWVICGCESGPKSRPMQTEWALSLRDQCAATGVPFFMKQMMMVNGGLAHDVDDFPCDLRIRQFPT
jgi:protein gp37